MLSSVYIQDKWIKHIYKIRIFSHCDHILFCFIFRVFLCIMLQIYNPLPTVVGPKQFWKPNIFLWTLLSTKPDLKGNWVDLRLFMASIYFFFCLLVWEFIYFIANILCVWFWDARLNPHFMDENSDTQEIKYFTKSPPLGFFIRKDLLCERNLILKLQPPNICRNASFSDTR